MPYVSHQQRKYFNANRAELESQGVDVGEWNDASRGKKLPKRVKKKKASKEKKPMTYTPVTQNTTPEIPVTATHRAGTGYPAGAKAASTKFGFDLASLWQNLSPQAQKALLGGGLGAAGGGLAGRLLTKDKDKKNRNMLLGSLAGAGVGAGGGYLAGGGEIPGLPKFSYHRRSWIIKQSIATGIGAIIGAMKARKGNRLRGAAYGGGVGAATDTGIGVGALGGGVLGGIGGGLLGIPGGPVGIAAGSATGAGLGGLVGGAAGGYGGYRAGREVSKDVGKGSGRGEPWDKDPKKKETETSSEKESEMKLAIPQAVTKMGHYLSYLAAMANKGNHALHIKQARVNVLTKLSQALHGKRNILDAIKVAYPRTTEAQRFKMATRLINGLGEAMRKAAARKKKAMGEMSGGGMGAAGGELGGMMGGGGDGNTGSIVSSPQFAGGPGQGGQPGGFGATGGIQSAPSYSHSSAVSPSGIANVV